MGTVASTTSSCAHCGLPARPAARGGPAYCCAGCAVTAAVLDAARRRGANPERALLLRLGLAAFFTSNVMVLTLFLYSGEAAPAAAMALVRGLLAAFAAPVFLLLAPPFAAGLVRDARRLRFSMDGLIALGAGSAFAFSCASVARGRGEIYFDTATMVLLLVTAGRFLEAHAHVSGRRALAELLSLQPLTARVRRGAGWATVEVSSLRAGDRIETAAGERISADGRVVRGAAAVDESALTGEALPAERIPGDPVRAGSLCLNGALEIEVACEPRDSLVARIVQSVEEAQRARSPLESIADRASAALGALALLLAAATVAWWWHVGPEPALLNGLSVLVVACPCALGIALPLVNVVALATAARRGILIRSGEALERLARVDTFALDKTGTVTAGRVEVSAVEVFGGTVAEVLAAAASAAAGSRHPVSRAVLHAAERSGARPTPARRTEELPGRGVRAELDDGRNVLLGQPRWVAAEAGGAPLPPEAAVLCAAGGRLIGAFELADPVTPEACAAAAALRASGARVLLLSGDRPASVASAAGALGIAEAEGGLLPDEKAARVRALERNGRRVAMVGDGVNDAPALAAAHVGIAASGGTDVARETAQVVMLAPGLARVVDAWRLARAARSLGIRNLAWAAAYNSIALAAAASGLLRPLWAAVLMLASSVVVVANALRLPAHFARRGSDCTVSHD